jgi:hypothetical protein
VRDATNSSTSAGATSSTARRAAGSPRIGLASAASPLGPGPRLSPRGSSRASLAPVNATKERITAAHSGNACVASETPNPARRRGFRLVQCGCPRPELNQRTRFRKVRTSAQERAYLQPFRSHRTAARQSLRQSPNAGPQRTSAGTSAAPRLLTERQAHARGARGSAAGAARAMCCPARRSRVATRRCAMTVAAARLYAARSSLYE